MTVNVHKGFSFLNRRFVLRELRDAIREVGADLVFLQEVHGIAPPWRPRAGRGTGGSALRVPGRSDLAGLRLRAQCGVHAWRPRQRAAVEVPDPAFGKRRRLGRDTREAWPAALRASPAWPRAHRARHLRPSGVEAVAPTAAAAAAVRFRRTARAGRRAAARGWRLQRLALQCARACCCDCAGLDEVFVEAHGRAAPTFPARWPLLPLDRIYVRGVRDHAPLVLPARPWTGLSDHAPIAAEIRL